MFVFWGLTLKRCCKSERWKTSTKKIVKNKELWMQLDNLINKHSVNWKWIKGHSGLEYNEKADVDAPGSAQCYC